MPIERPLLTARWTELVMLSFAVPEEVVARLAPAGTVPDLFDGQAYASVIGFVFRDARFLGLRFPGHSHFEEVNLRFYVRRNLDRPVMARSPDHAIQGVCAGSGDPRTTAVRRGVVFVREIAPRPLVAAVARWVYNESYVTRPMRSHIERVNDEARMANDEIRPFGIRHSPLDAGSRVGYEWRTGGWRHRTWNRVAVHAAADPHFPTPGSLEEFIIEHYWAYVRGRDGSTWEYRVAHRPWRVAPVTNVVWDCDVAATYDDTALAEYLAAPPTSAFIADGSPVQVFRGRRIDADHNPRRDAPALDTQFAMPDAGW